ncbi:type II toxin-antitoxin system VapC family toxin [Acidobacteria bacterium AH-259-A15]|nr:type II toxin-antitoxin system VapC family toxin [Acidobacteria bacterium AH-259-A15]
MKAQDLSLYYLDTSAYLCILLNEEGTAGLVEELRGQRLVSSVLLILEANRNLVRLSRLGHLSPAELNRCLERVREDQALFWLRDLTLDLSSGWDMPVVSTPRSLDLVHLRSALWFHKQKPLTRFVSFDDAQNQAAQELDLPVTTEAEGQS